MYKLVNKHCIACKVVVVVALCWADTPVSIVFLAEVCLGDRPRGNDILMIIITIIWVIHIDIFDMKLKGMYNIFHWLTERLFMGHCDIGLISMICC